MTSPRHLIFWLQRHLHNHDISVLVFCILGRRLILVIIVKYGGSSGHTASAHSIHTVLFSTKSLWAVRNVGMTEVEIRMKGMNVFSPNSFYSSTLNIIPDPGNIKNGTLMLQHDWKSGIIPKQGIDLVQGAGRVPWSQWKYTPPQPQGIKLMTG